MGREIKFRLWDKSSKKMCYPNITRETWYFDDEYNSIHFPLNVIGFMPFKESNDAVLLQYTGLKEKNKKEIYEGDIVKVFPFTGCYHIVKPTLFEIKFENAKFIAEGINHGISQVHLDYYSNHCEIIGSIYENPELLKGDR
jgi:uncharacterized phage protein (TIGR01671 family)